MMEMLFVALGGAAGSIARFQAGKALNERYAGNAPFGTFLVNITGAFLLGLVTTTVKSKSWELLIADGFLGAYTTFSALLYEGYMLYRADDKKKMVIYLGGSLMTGVLGFGLGMLLGLSLSAAE